jgi:hypothetical protein
VLRAERHGKQIFYTAADEHVRSVITDMVTHANEVPDTTGTTEIA